MTSIYHWLNTDRLVPETNVLEILYAVLYADLLHLEVPHPKDDHDLETVGYKALMERIDTILMGSNSYKQILGFGNWGWPDKQTYNGQSGSKIIFTEKIAKAGGGWHPLK